MKILSIAVFLSANFLCAQAPPQMQMGCGDSGKVSADEQIAMLSKDIDRRDGQTIECMFSYMDGLSRSEDLRALPLIARYLDLPNPRLGRDFGKGGKIGHPVLFGGKFPAINYIIEYRQDAVPILVQTIASESELTLEGKNAVLALMVIEAPDPSKGVRLLAEAARKSSGASARVLFQAAQFATTAWECHLILAKCEEALTVEAAPQQPEAKP